MIGLVVIKIQIEIVGMRRALLPTCCRLSKQVCTNGAHIQDEHARLRTQCTAMNSSNLLNPKSEKIELHFNFI